MEKKMTDLEARMNGLEERLKFVFGEIEKRLDQARPHEEYTTEERLQELEDLLLLLQLEITKVKEKVGETSIDFGITATTPDIAERLAKIEEEISRGDATAEPDGSMGTINTAAEAKIAEMDQKIKHLYERPAQAGSEHHAAASQEIAELEKRIRTLEALLEKRGREEIESESSLLSDVQKILRH